ncbi:MAG: DNA polymerase III subunit alpha [Lachnospiraceae bacterium]|nr:DNA polymerase III subunit alpha [Lachnospiraceae bacterium]
MAFTHLHTHTEYSLLDGSNKITEYVKRVKELGMDSAAITDHGVMYGVIDFYRECRAQGIRPIIGCEVYVAPGSRFDRELKGGEDRYHHLILLAENNTGYANLCKIVSKGFTEGFYYRPRVDAEVLRKYHEGIICASACLAGEVPRLILKGLMEEAKEKILEYNEIFGHGNYFLELQDHGLAEQQTVNSALLNYSKELDIPLIATNDIHYTYAEDVESHDVLLCIQTGKRVSDEDRMRYEGGQFFVKSEEEMAELFKYAPEAIENTHKIAERCNVEIEFGHTKLPHYEVPDGYTSYSYLEYLCNKGLNERYLNDPSCDEERKKSLEERLSYELSVISRMGYVDYFLIVWDFINYAREHDIPVGPGRGSAAGSIVSYCLHITNIDPIRYQLLFERFLNPERVSMPDIDIDFCFERRQEVIDYVGRKYGQEKVVQIVTFGTLAAKGVIKDVGRAMDLPYAYTDSISKMIPNELNITIDRALELNKELRSKYETEEDLHKLIDICKKLEGLPRHTSMHAAGVVICPEAADEFVPLSRGSDGSITTQFTMTTLEELGLLKMDFLGLRTLTVIKKAIDNIRDNTGTEIDLDNLDYNDKAVYDLIGTGHTEGIFQLESAGMKSFMKELKPHSLEDIIAGISLYRPGPMDFIPKYIQGKNSGDTVTYATPELEHILAPTYGCIVYQEQVMQIVRDLAGYSMGEADNIRRAMSKKKQYVIDEGRKDFVGGNPDKNIAGCVANGISVPIADSIYDSMTDFAKYAFNKSHAACYAVVAYQTAYLKKYYPVEFMAALMTSVIDNTGKVSEYILTCRAMGIDILPPDVNEGAAGFAVSGSSIRYALNAIKGAGYNVINAIVEERKAGGLYKNLEDFISRNASGEINKRVMENFIKAGAFDSFGGTRKQYMSIYPKAMDRIVGDRKNNVAGQISLFDIANEDDKSDYDIKLPDVGEYTKELKLAFEKEVLGIYISGHPLEEYEGLLKKHATNITTDLYYAEENGSDGMRVKDGEFITLGGIVTDRNVKYTKNNQAMAFVNLEDLAGNVECIVFPKTYEKYGEMTNIDDKVFIRGRVSASDEDNGKLIAETITPFDQIGRDLWLRFKAMEDYEAKSGAIMDILKESDGRDRVIIYIDSTRQKKALGANMTVSGEGILTRLKELIGEDNVKLV